MERCCWKKGAKSQSVALPSTKLAPQVPQVGWGWGCAGVALGSASSA